MSALKKTAQWSCQEALPLVLGNHQDPDGNSSKNSVLASKLHILSPSWEDGCGTKDNKHFSKL